MNMYIVPTDKKFESPINLVYSHVHLCY